MKNNIEQTLIVPLLVVLNFYALPILVTIEFGNQTVFERPRQSSKILIHAGHCKPVADPPQCHTCSQLINTSFICSQIAGFQEFGALPEKIIIKNHLHLHKMLHICICI